MATHNTTWLVLATYSTIRYYKATHSSKWLYLGTTWLLAVLHCYLRSYTTVPALVYVCMHGCLSNFLPAYRFIIRAHESTNPSSSRHARTHARTLARSLARLHACMHTYTCIHMHTCMSASMQSSMHNTCIQIRSHIKTSYLHLNSVTPFDTLLECELQQINWIWSKR